MKNVSKHLDKLVAAARYLVEHCDEDIKLADLAEHSNLSPSRFQHLFKEVLSITPKQLQKLARTQRFRDLLRSGISITDAIIEAGYGSNARLYSDSSESLGMTPAAYQRGASGESISWVCRSTPFGKLAIAASDRGLCFAQFASHCDELVDLLHQEFPNAVLIPFEEDSNGQLTAWINQLIAYLERSQPIPDIPLDLRGTAFQVKVWQFLKGLSDGQRITYSELAQGIGSPRAVRAAASACAANRIALLVPCHRVLRGDGGLGGYRWGMERKQALLDSEASMQSG